MPKKINYGWPATLFDVQVDQENQNYSRGKLKVFYKGETEDHRYFSDEFSETVIQTLPYTPIVSKINKDKDDFEGHASQQELFGIVDPCVAPTFEVQEDGKEWCICDVVLYTERPDHVGEWAKKIVGHKQSLELNPKDTKYIINYDEKKHFKNIEFTAGSFIGVSVLGNDQEPAFSGSEFFSFTQDKLDLLRKYCENKNANSGHNGSEKMNLVEFMKLSWGDISVKVNEALSESYDNEYYWYIVDYFDDSVIVRWYSYYDGKQSLVRINYSVDAESGVVTLGNVSEVRIEYVDAEPQASTNMSNTETSTEGTSENNGETQTEDTPANTEETQTNASSDPVDNKDFASTTNSQEPATTEAGVENSNSNETTTPASDNGSVENQPAEGTTEFSTNNSNVQTGTDDSQNNNLSSDTNNSNADNIPTTTEKESVDNVPQKSEENQGSSTTSFTQSERAEFENLKREKKINILNSFKDYLTEDEFNTFEQTIDNYSDKDLEIELLRIYKNKSGDSNKTERAFALDALLNKNAKSDNNSLDSFVRSHLR